LRRIGEALLARGSGYAAVLQALLVIAGEAALDVAPVRRVADRAEDLDQDWFEQPAFGAEPASGAVPMPGKMPPAQ